MTVENTNPIQHFTANGQSTAFAIGFAVEDKDNLKVTVNGTTVSVNDYSYDVSTNSVVFNTAPVGGVEVVIERITSLERSINYQTYNNSFRPETLNYDLDRIWHVLQEDHITDANIIARIKDEIEWRRTHNTEWDQLAQAREQGLFNALKSYMDTIGVMSVPNLFDGITDNVVITEDGVSQRVTNRDLKQAQADLHTAMDDLEQATTAYVDSEKYRAIQVESDLSNKISEEETRALREETLLQTQLNALGVGNRAYLTYAAMVADKTNTAAKSKITVTNDTDETKNGDYQYDGTTFTKSAYDALTQSKNFALANPLFKPSELKSTDNLDNIKTSGLYIARTNIPNLSNNYPTTSVGVLVVYEVFTGSTGTIGVQIYYSGLANHHYIRYTNGSGTAWLSWDKIATLTDVSAKIKELREPIFATVGDIDLNTLTESTWYNVYSTAETSVSNHPVKGEQAFLQHVQFGGVKRQVYYCRSSHDIYKRWSHMFEQLKAYL